MPCWSAQCTPAVQGVAAARSESAAAAFIAIIIWSARASVVRLISLRTYERLLAWSPYTQVSLEVRRHDKTRSKSGFRGYNEKRSYKKKKRGKPFLPFLTPECSYVSSLKLSARGIH